MVRLLASRTTSSPGPDGRRRTVAGAVAAAGVAGRSPVSRAPREAAVGIAASSRRV
ncbi:hypothetical protein ACFQ10_49325 [Streptomyces indonesiensis]